MPQFLGPQLNLQHNEPESKRFHIFDVRGKKIRHEKTIFFLFFRFQLHGRVTEITWTNYKLYNTNFA